MKFKYIIFSVLVYVVVAWGGSKIPHFDLNDLKNNQVTFNDIKGETLTVIDFWATWCKPCARAIPKLNQLFEQFKKEGVAFIGINVDSPRNEAKIKPFVHAYKMKYMVLRDPNSEYASELNISGFPTLIIVDNNDEIVYIHQGYRVGDEVLIKNKIVELISKNANKKPSDN